MNLDQKYAWIDALESGDYIQSQDQLCTQAEDGSYSYCCLGVLCEINGVLDKDAEPKPFANSETRKENRTIAHGRDGYLPPKVLESFGMDYSFMERVAGMNDQEGYSFEEIAQYIRDNLEIEE